MLLTKGSIQMIGFGSVEPPVEELEDTETTLRKLMRNGLVVTDKMRETLREKVGIEFRWRSNRDATDLALAGAILACEDAARRDSNFSIDKLGFIHYGSSTPHRTYPGTAGHIQSGLGIPPLKISVRDFSQGCTSWSEAVMLMYQTQVFTDTRYGLVVTSDNALSRVANQASFSTTLWGDAGAATVIRYDREGTPYQGIISQTSLSDGAKGEMIVSRGQGSALDARGEVMDVDMGRHGPSLQRYVLENLPDLIRAELHKANLQVNDRTWLVPHNSNLMMVNAIGEDLGIPPTRVLTRVRERGNSAGASLPLNLAYFDQANYFSPGDLGIIVSFGSGLAINIMLYIWA